MQPNQPQSQNIQAQPANNQPSNAFGNAPQPAPGVAVDPSIPQDQPMMTGQAPATPPTGADADAPKSPDAAAMDNDPLAGLQLDPTRVKQFTKNLAFLYTESVNMTGLPIDVLLQQVVQNAAHQGLPGGGHMISYGPEGFGFAPNQDVLEGWIGNYFIAIIQQQKAVAEQIRAQ